jgi:hypothetical protein
MKTTAKNLHELKRTIGLTIAPQNQVDSAIKFGCVKLKDKTIYYGSVTEVIYAGSPFVLLTIGDDARLIAPQDISQITTVTGAQIVAVKLTTEQILQAVCDYYETPKLKLCSNQRTEELCLMRWIAFKLMREAGHTLCAIGETFRRDHGTVGSGLRSYEDRIETDPDYAKQVEEIRIRLGLQTSATAVSSC